MTYFHTKMTKHICKFVQVSVYSICDLAIKQTDQYNDEFKRQVCTTGIEWKKTFILYFHIFDVKNCSNV